MRLPQLLITALLPASALLHAEGRLEFNRDVRPVLAAKCFACHGPDEDKREAGLRLDVRAEAVKQAIKPGRPGESEVWHRITTSDPDDVMPPPSSPKPLTKAEREILGRWITEGAEYQEHWSFLPIQRTPPPRDGFEPVSSNPVDLFIQHRLARHGLRPAPEAEPATLVRRLFLDLTGLPPGPSDLAGLNQLSDSAYRALVERLLASPNFGERWARHWLDMARYADSNGFLGDGLRPNAWLYRDWVISAINQDLPYDQFTLRQIAGDLLPGASTDHLTATGFHRNAALNTEAGVDKEEARYQNLVDRVNTTGRVWLGLTVGCAQCHTHKYDPITIRDYYGFYAYFNNTEDRDEARTKAQMLAEVSKDRRQTYVHLAGDYTRRGPDVQPATLSALPGRTGGTRLDLARWIVSPQNPLTARVAVNQVWSKLFGAGLVGTPDDFGSTGEPPSHPGLLDWLASEFMRRGWSRKELIRLIVTSHTYRQSSAHRADIVELDPLNRLLARQNRIRLDAEILRDSVLAVSGMLTARVGGPSFRPPLPEDVFEVGRSSNWQASPGAELYRRSLYIITLRSVLYPLLTTFDGPDAADACVRRERSNTPLQALAMMNDGVFVEAARSLALRALGKSPADRLPALFQLVLNRPPRPEELARLKAFHEGQAARVQNEGAEALKILGPFQDSLPAAKAVEAAPLVATARVLMNLDEFINRE
jgi:mono/diheme cytochrome c family protein